MQRIGGLCKLTVLLDAPNKRDAMRCMDVGLVLEDALGKAKSETCATSTSNEHNLVELHGRRE